MAPKTKKAEKLEKKSPAKATKAEKSGKKGAEEVVRSEDMTEAEEQKALEAAGEDSDDADFDEGSNSSSNTSSSSDDEGMLALTTKAGTESSVSFKNFRHHPDMENFYRFVYENDLRYEALGIIDQMLGEKLARREIKAAKSKAH